MFHFLCILNTCITASFVIWALEQSKVRKFKIGKIWSCYSLGNSNSDVAVACAVYSLFLVLYVIIGQYLRHRIRYRDRVAPGAPQFSKVSIDCRK